MNCSMTILELVCDQTWKSKEVKFRKEGRKEKRKKERKKERKKDLLCY